MRLTPSAICGTDLDVIRGTLSGMKPGTFLGHEGVGVIEEVGSNVRNLQVGDRIVVPSTLGCGFCAYYRAGYYARCGNINPSGPRAGTAFFGCGPVGQFAITSALIVGAGMVFAVDKIPSRLEVARAQGAITVNFDEEE